MADCHRLFFSDETRIVRFCPRNVKKMLVRGPDQFFFGEQQSTSMKS